jgi:hypothetical protein
MFAGDGYDVRDVPEVNDSVITVLLLLFVLYAMPDTSVISFMSLSSVLSDCLYYLCCL